MSDNVNSPAHYKGAGMEAIEVIEAWKLDYHLGNALKYFLRHKKKGAPIEDLKKARWYVERVVYLIDKNDINYSFGVSDFPKPLDVQKAFDLTTPDKDLNNLYFVILYELRDMCSLSYLCVLLSTLIEKYEKNAASSR